MALQVSALVIALMASARINLRVNNGQYFVGSGDDLHDVRDSDRLLRLALILGISGYWAYVAVAISVAVGLGIISYTSSSSKCLSRTWLLTAVVRCLIFYRRLPDDLLSFPYVQIPFSD